jgi:hypothetical protein
MFLSMGGGGCVRATQGNFDILKMLSSKSPLLGKERLSKFPTLGLDTLQGTHVFQCKHTVYTGLNLVKIETLCIKYLFR